MTAPLLSIRDLVIDYGKGPGQFRALHGCSFDLEPGQVMEPTAVLAADNDSRVCQEEIFGPFAAFLRFSGREEAAAIANNSPFGLVGYAWTQNLDTALWISRNVRTGLMWVNTPLMRELRAPFGGIKDSGIGRDGAAASRDFFTDEKTVTIPLTDVPLRKLGQG